jgi:hypothetical protein
MESLRTENIRKLSREIQKYAEDKGDKLAMFVRLVDSKANLHKLLVSQGKVREAQNVHSEWKALVEVANLLGIESQLEMIKKEE